MIHFCIYDNIFDKGGYKIHAKSADFPIQYESDIMEVSCYFSPGRGSRETTAIRYAPLRNGKYLLSWVQRHPVTYEEGQRAWHTVVHFLMDGKDADALFRHPISRIAERVEQTARDLLNYDSQLPAGKKKSKNADGPVEFFSQDEPAANFWYTEEAEFDRKMMAGAGYCMGSGRPKQMFLATEVPYEELECLQSRLPYGLRKKLSFCVGLQNQTECTGTIFNFPTEMTLDQLQDAPGESPPMSDKFWQGNQFGEKRLCDEYGLILQRLAECSLFLREMIFTVITEWAQLQLLATEQLSDGLGELIRYSDQEAWCKMVRKHKMNSSELRELQALIPRKKYTKAVRAEIKKRLNMPSNGKKKTGANEKVTGKETNTGSEDTALKKILWNNVRRLAAVVVMVVAAIALVTFFRQVLVKETVVVEQVVYYCISREAAVDVLKLCGTYLCGVLSACAVIGLIGSFTRKE